MNPELKEYLIRGFGMLTVVTLLVYLIALDASKSENNNSVTELARAAEVASYGTDSKQNAETIVPSAADVSAVSRVDRNEVDDVLEPPDKDQTQTSWIPQTGSLVYCREMGWGDGQYLFPQSVIIALLEQGIIFENPGEYVKVADDGSAEIVPRFGSAVIPTTKGQTCVFAQSELGQ